MKENMNRYSENKTLTDMVRFSEFCQQHIIAEKKLRSRGCVVSVVLAVFKSVLDKRQRLRTEKLNSGKSDPGHARPWWRGYHRNARQQSNGKDATVLSCEERTLRVY